MRALVAERDAARAAKDYATSDRIREELSAMGLEVMDTPEGTKVRPRD
jgi:cysteinyl-tRNA synthetase